MRSADIVSAMNKQASKHYSPRTQNFRRKDGQQGPVSLAVLVFVIFVAVILRYALLLIFTFRVLSVLATTVAVDGREKWRGLRWPA
jgi:hypothetical protein